MVQLKGLSKMAFDKIKKFSKDTFNTITTRADIAIITNDVKMTILFLII